MAVANNVNVTENGMTLEQAVALANEIERVEAAAKQMKDDLRKFVEQNGSVETADKVWSLNEAVSYEFEDMREVAEKIAIDGKNPWDYIGITAANLKKLEWDEAFLSKLGKRKVSVRFGSRKK